MLAVLVTPMREGGAVTWFTWLGRPVYTWESRSGTLQHWWAYVVVDSTTSS